MVRKVLVGLAVSVLLGSPWASAADSERPEPVSPGSQLKVETVAQECPTFSWASVPRASGYRLVVFGVTPGGELGEAVIRHRVAAGVSSWTPSLEQGLARGESYAWTVGALTLKGETLWSEPALFRVAPGPSRTDFEEAVAVVQAYLAGSSETPGVERASANPDGAAGAAPGVTAESPSPLAPAGTQMSVDGNVDAVSFSGSGTLLTALDPANLSPGTAAIDIIGTAATATDLVGAACVSESELTFDPATQAEMVASLASYYTQANLQGDGVQGGQAPLPRLREDLDGLLRAPADP